MKTKIRVVVLLTVSAWTAFAGPQTGGEQLGVSSAVGAEFVSGEKGGPLPPPCPPGTACY